MTHRVKLCITKTLDHQSQTISSHSKHPSIYHGKCLCNRWLHKIMQHMMCQQHLFRLLLRFSRGWVKSNGLDRQVTICRRQYHCWAQGHREETMHRTRLHSPIHCLHFFSRHSFLMSLSSVFHAFAFVADVHYPEHIIFTKSTRSR